jgi:capsular polysaccharide biosynthesis protein
MLFRNVIKRWLFIVLIQILWTLLACLFSFYILKPEIYLYLLYICNAMSSPCKLQ